MAQRVVHRVGQRLASGGVPAWFSDGFKPTFRTETLVLVHFYR